MPKLQAPGPSGLRTEHIIAATHNRGTCVREVVASLIARVCDGDVPSDDTYVRNIRLTPLTKPPSSASVDRDWRPIGVGEIFRRVAARMANKALLEEVGDRLAAAGQYGVAHAGTLEVFRRVTDEVNAGACAVQISTSRMLSAPSTVPRSCAQRRR